MAPRASGRELLLSVPQCDSTLLGILAAVQHRLLQLTGPCTALPAAGPCLQHVPGTGNTSPALGTHPRYWDQVPGDVSGAAPCSKVGERRLTGTGLSFSS